MTNVDKEDAVETKKVRSSRFKWWICIIAIFLLAANCSRNVPRFKCPYANNSASKIDQKLIELFDDILAAEKQPKDGRNIFFHDTTSLEGVVTLNARQACSIESAAKSNPDSDVFVMFASPVGHDRDAGRSVLLQAVAGNYSNVHFRNVNIEDYAKETPAAEWMRGRNIYKSDFLSAHQSELLRLLSLYRFGGTYLDMDFVVQTSLANVSRNFAGFERPMQLSSSVLNFEQHGVGRLIAEKCIREFINQFNGKTSPTPMHIQNVLQDVCNTNDLSKCRLFKVFAEKAFYPIPSSKWWSMFDPVLKDSAATAATGSMAVKTWSNLSGETALQPGSFMKQMARKQCPRVYAAAAVGGQSFL